MVGRRLPSHGGGNSCRPPSVAWWPSERRAAKERASVKCKSCGEDVDPRRVELGYDYCTRRECQERLVNRIELARVTVNKAADQYVRADELGPKAPGVRWGID